MINISWVQLVPNAPCGVESRVGNQPVVVQTVEVPNAPCGVESIDAGGNSIGQPITRFLMHRVELKDCFGKQSYH